MALIGDTSDLNTFAYGGKPLLPDRDSYQLTAPNGVVQSNIAGGLTKLGLQYFNSPAMVSVTYALESLSKIAFVKSFLRNNQGGKFITHLAVDNGAVEPYVVQYLGSPNIQETGFNGFLRLNLEVQPSFDPCYDKFLNDYLACLGDGACEFFDLVTAGVEGKPDANA